MKENSIEEDIKIVDNFVTYFNGNIQNGYKADLTVLGEEIEAIEHILSDYKRVLKENEQLKKNMSKKKELDILSKEDIKILKSRTYYEPNDCLAFIYKENGKNISMKRVDKAIERLLKQIERRKSNGTSNERTNTL